MANKYSKSNISKKAAEEKTMQSSQIDTEKALTLTKVGVEETFQHNKNYS